MAYKLAVVAALGPPAAAVLVLEVLLNATAMFNHANLALPQRVDRLLRLLRCDELQGFHLGRPMTVDAFERMFLR